MAWPVLPATLFLEFVRNGDRGRYEARHFARRTALQFCETSRRHQSGHLRQPGWGMPFKDRQKSLSTCLPTQTSNRLQERLVCFSHAEVLHTLRPCCLYGS